MTRTPDTIEMRLKPIAAGLATSIGLVREDPMAIWHIAQGAALARGENLFQNAIPRALEGRT